MMLKPVYAVNGLLLPLLLLAGGFAQAEPSAAARAPDPVAAMSPQDYAKLPVCALSADGKRLAVEPCRTAPAQKPMPRRPVMQIIEPTQRMRVAQQVAMPAMQPSPSLHSLLNPPGAPIPTAGCDAGGCYGAGGTRLNNAAPGATLSPSGKICNRSGAWVQCP